MTIEEKLIINLREQISIMKRIIVKDNSIIEILEEEIKKRDAIIYEIRANNK